MKLSSVCAAFVTSVQVFEKSFPSVEAPAEAKMPSLQFIKAARGLFVRAHVEQMDLAWKSISFGFSLIAFPRAVFSGCHRFTVNVRYFSQCMLPPLSVVRQGHRTGLTHRKKHRLILIGFRLASSTGSSLQQRGRDGEKRRRMTKKCCANK